MRINSRTLLFISIASVLFFTSLILPTFAQAAGPLGDEVLYYDFEGTTGTSTNGGSAGAANDGTFVGNASTTNTIFKFGSRSGSFGETGDYLRTWYGSGTNPTSQSLSVSMWVYKKEASAGCNTGDDDHFFGVSGPQANTRFYLRCTNNFWNMRFGASAATSTPTSIVHQTWTHLALVFDAANDLPKLYVDGVLRATSPIVASFVLGDNFFVGNFNDRVNNTFNEGSNMNIDDFALYTRPLTTGEITTLYNLGVSLSAPTIATSSAYSTKVYLGWNAVGGAVNDYLLEYKLSADSTWTAFADGVSTSTFATVTGLTNGQSYDFRVAAANFSSTSASSTPVTVVPNNRIAFVSPTPTEASYNSSPISVSASSSGMTASSTHTLRLETSVGSLISEISTTTRYGNFNLSQLTPVVENVDLSLTANSSGIAYAPGSNTLFVVHNVGAGLDTTIDEITTSGSLVRSITCTACGDIEGIARTNTVADGTGSYIHSFTISTENNTANAEVFRITISSSTTAVNTSDVYSTGISHSANGGLEGIAYNSSTDTYYLARELSTPTLYEYKLGGTATPICTNLSLGAGVTDFSDLTYVNNTLFVLSENTNPSKLIPINITSTSTCTLVDSNGNGTASSSDTGDWLMNIPVGGTDQAEGVTWDDTGDYLYALGEADFLAKYRTTSFTTRGTFSGLAAGAYVLKSTFTDQSGITETASQRSFNIGTPDTTAPIISSIVATPSVTSVTIQWNTNEAASSSVAYGLTTSYGTVATSTDTTTTHTVTITGLTANTAYNFNVYARDAAGNIATSSNQTFTTTASPSSSSGSSGTATVVPGALSAVSGFSSWSQTPNGINQGNNQVQNNPNNPSPKDLITKDLVYRMADQQVKLLQQILNKNKSTVLAATGIGSSGKETSYFGPATLKAVQKFQLLNAIVSSPKENGYGRVGPKTRAVLNAIDL